MLLKPLSAIFDRGVGLGLVCEVSRGEVVNTLGVGVEVIIVRWGCG